MKILERVDFFFLFSSYALYVCWFFNQVYSMFWS